MDPDSRRLPTRRHTHPLTAIRDLRRRFAAALDGFEVMTDWLWWLAITFFGAGDLLTTAFGATTTTVIEGSPIVTSVIHGYGLLGLLGLKIVALVAAYFVWEMLPEPHDVGVPLALGVLGVGLTTWNIFVIGYVFAA